MNDKAHPSTVLCAGARPAPALAACEHYAGSEKLLQKSLEMQQQTGPLFDITADCEDGAPAGGERDHAARLGFLIAGDDNRFDRVGARIHDVRHPAWREEAAMLTAQARERLAYLVLPKAESYEDVATQAEYIEEMCFVSGIERDIPLHVLIETPGALRDVWRIAAMEQVESIDFGLMDFVSAHHGAIPAAAMRSPGQFEHPLIARAKCEIAAAAHAAGVIPAHNVSTELNDMDAVAADARRARDEFGFLRMWSIHPKQIPVIIAAMQPDFNDVEAAAQILCAAQDADWGPIRFGERLHDCASYRYYWELLQRAAATGLALPQQAQQRFFT